MLEVKHPYSHPQGYRYGCALEVYRVVPFWRRALVALVQGMAVAGGLGAILVGLVCLWPAV